MLARAGLHEEDRSGGKDGRHAAAKEPSSAASKLSEHSDAMTTTLQRRHDHVVGQWRFPINAKTAPHATISKTHELLQDESAGPKPRTRYMLLVRTGAGLADAKKEVQCILLMLRHDIAARQLA